MSALTFNSVRKMFGPTVALEHFQLSISPGELISLLGPSGCGKTTALRIAAGFERPTAGAVIVADKDITNVAAHKRNMGMVFQSYSLFPNLDVAKNVEFGLRTRKLPAQERKQRVAEMLELVQMPHMADRYPHQLSGGQQQRVALARALAIRPQVLLLDEPLSALDAKVRLSLRDEIRRIQTELGITTLLVTHDQEEALGIADRVGVMSNGRLEQLASPSEVYSSPASAFVARFVGSMNELPARVRDSDSVEVAGIPLAVPAARNHTTGDAVTLLVRPEDLTVRAENEPGFPGTVTSNTFEGAATMIGVRLDVLDVLVHAEIPSSVATGLVPGQRVSVEIDATRGVCELPTEAAAADDIDAA
jgi:putative spermidine/putrescine transport system ATP-binding protein